MSSTIPHANLCSRPFGATTGTPSNYARFAAGKEQEMPNESNDGGAFTTGPLDAGPEQGGSNMGGLGATGAMDRDRDPEAEGFAKKPATSTRENAILEDEEGELSADGGS